MNFEKDQANDAVSPVESKRRFGTAVRTGKIRSA